MNQQITGILEIDHKRGVVYFHSDKTAWTVLRICRLGKLPKKVEYLDITHMVGVEIKGK